MVRGKNVIPGDCVLWNDESYIVLDLTDIERAIVRSVKSSKTEQAPIVELLPHKQDVPIREDLLIVPDEDWKEALKKFQIILPLLNDTDKKRPSKDKIMQAAEEANVNHVTVYRWIRKYEETGLVSSLLRPRRRDIGKSRLDSDAEELMCEIISNFYLSKQKPSVAETCLEVARVFHEKNLKSPHPNTIRARINQISDQTRMSKRLSAKQARERFTPLRGSFPGADFPLSVVQIDHTPVDLTLVDDAERLPIGRPYITIAIDVYTRMITGFCITLEAPSAMSVGLCIAHSVLPKEELLAKYGIQASWPIWGKMQKIHVDNAREFRGTMLERACAEHGITLQHRPKGLPNYGGHVERAFLTFMKKTHGVAGTTFSNVQDKGEYDTDKHASMTLAEFEKWFTTFIVEVYHQRSHSGIGGRLPIKFYEESVMGTDDKPGIGMPMRIENEQKFRLDFTPFVERTIQEYGVLIDHIHYYDDTLRRYIHARDPENPKLKRKFIFARDPRDISTVYFFDPETRTYAPISYRDISRPAVSVWELNSSLRRLSELEIMQPNEEMIFNGIRKMREMEEEAVNKTKKARSARRNVQRRKQKVNLVEPVKTEQRVDLLATLSVDDYPEEEVMPFTDIKEAT